MKSKFPNGIQENMLLGGEGREEEGASVIMGKVIHQI